MGDAAGSGFNDPTPVPPVGGNPGITLGQQRLNVFNRAAQISGAALTSPVAIQVFASWPNLFCNDTSAVLGAAGPLTVHGGFEGAINPEVWYVQALANKLAGEDLNPDVKRKTRSTSCQRSCMRSVMALAS